MWKRMKIEPDRSWKHIKQLFERKSETSFESGFVSPALLRKIKLIPRF